MPLGKSDLNYNSASVDTFHPILFRSNRPGLFDRNDFEILVPVLDGFSLITYDYGSPNRYSKALYSENEIFYWLLNNTSNKS